MTKLAATAGLPAPPDSVGRYQIVGPLGRGAMGTVSFGVNIYPSTEIVESDAYPYRNFYISLEYHLLRESTGAQLRNHRFVARITGRF